MVSIRHHQTKTIRQRIEAYDLKKDEVDSILKKVEGHFQIACGMLYFAVHLKELTTGSVSHPNQWYLEEQGLGGGGRREAARLLSISRFPQQTATARLPSQPSPRTPRWYSQDDQSQFRHDG